MKQEECMSVYSVCVCVCERDKERKQERYINVF